MMKDNIEDQDPQVEDEDSEPDNENEGSEE